MFFSRRYLGGFYLNFFRHCEIFWKFFGLHQRVSPFNFETEWILKRPNGLPFYIFRHSDTVQTSQYWVKQFLKKTVKGGIKPNEALLDNKRHFLHSDLN